MLSKLKSDNSTVSRVYLCSWKIQLSFYNTKSCEYVCQTQGEDFADQREYIEHVRLRRPVLTVSEIIAKIRIFFSAFLICKKANSQNGFFKNISAFINQTFNDYYEPWVSSRWLDNGLVNVSTAISRNYPTPVVTSRMICPGDTNNFIFELGRDDLVK